jgi:hypothetical protein
MTKTVLKDGVIRKAYAIVAEKPVAIVLGVHRPVLVKNLLITSFDGLNIQTGR